MTPRAPRRRSPRTDAPARRPGRSSTPDPKPLPAERHELRVGYVPGVEPDRFARRWAAGERPARLRLVPVAQSRQEEALTTGEVDMCFVRLPLAPAPDDPLHRIELWEERPVVVVGEEHVLSVLDEVADADLAGETGFVEQHRDDAADRVALAATGVGYAPMPLSLARLHHRRDVVHRELRDGKATTIALVWPAAADDAVRQEFVGVVRGRTVRSSR